ncbi:ECF transporter S component [Arthrobacter zhaoxinii]|uniref:ECF transporter S component n=1 Tax=Arthrobacter zhaoxinii TaxID=2964616 RepID=A0ABY5YRP9_9MICC|nr:general stress protein [Arthrobacter zhaoxinii]UWX96375.1 ECF transporter S component [Arthrobacter zhaoxinii]
MSNLFGATPPRDAGRSLPQGETVGRYTAYLDAQKAVDYLADNKFPVQLVSIVGNELKSVERVTGRLTYPRVAGSSALTGAWFGLFVGLALMLFGGSAAAISILPSMALGAVFWVLFGVLAYALQRGRRDFTSTSQVIATSYDVIVAREAANDARQLLHRLPMVGQAGHPQAPAAGPRHDALRPPAGGQQAPERPSGWANPYGSPAPDSDPAGQAPAGGAHAVEAGAEAAASGAKPATPRGQFPDLPDGRPQYGVRRPVQPAVQSDSGQPDSAQPAVQPDSAQPAATQPASGQPEGPRDEQPRQ